MQTELKVEGMSCGHCVAGVKGALESVPGVTTATVSLEANNAVVEHDATATVETLIAAVVEEGYKASQGATSHPSS